MLHTKFVNMLHILNYLTITKRCHDSYFLGVQGREFQVHG